MAQTILSPYFIRVYQMGGRTPLVLSKFDGKNDAFDFLERFLQSLKSNYVQATSTRKLLRVETLANSQRELRGTFGGGGWGIASKLIDVKSLSPTYNRKVDEAEVIPFYYFASIPVKRDEGLFILQKTGQQGIRKEFTDMCQAEFRKAHPDYRIAFSPFSDAEYIQQILSKNSVKRIRMIKFKVREDLADKFLLGDHAEKDAYMDLSIVARRNRALPIPKGLKQYFDKKKFEHSPILEIPDFEPDVIKLEVGNGKIRRTLDLSRLLSLGARYDVTDKVALDKDGHPVFNSVDSVTKDLAKEIWEAIGNKEDGHE